MTGTEADRATRAAQLVRLAEGYQATQLLYVAVRLGVPEALADRPRSSAELAGALGADRGVLHRVLRGLAAEGVLDERPGGGFALTELGQLLRPDVPASQRGAVLARGSLYYRSLAGIFDRPEVGARSALPAVGGDFFAGVPPGRAAPAGGRTGVKRARAAPAAGGRLVGWHPSPITATT